MLSVIIPVYNGIDYIEKCVDSLHIKYNPSVEFIIVDDGSTDGTASLCDTIATQYNNLTTYHKPNGGSASARNLGISKSHGSWVWFVDSDDIVCPSAFDAIKECIAEYQPEVIYSPPAFFADSPTWEKQPCAFERIQAETFLYGTYQGAYAHFNWAYVFSRKVLERCAASLGRPLSALYREDVVLYEDVLFCETFLRETREIIALSNPIYACRRNPNSVTNKRNSEVANSGLTAIRLLPIIPLPKQVERDRVRMELGLLFSVYKLLDTDSLGKQVKNEVNKEIALRVQKLGLSQLGVRLFVRYIAKITHLIDLIVFLRDIK